MPIYQIYHSYPLTREQRQKLATAITDLHCTTFTTPSFFVHIRFIFQDANDETYFMAGKPRTTNTNRIVGIVRTSPARSKSDFDTLGEKIEDAWYRSLEPTPSGAETALLAEAKRLLLVTFTPLIAIREGGMTIPEAGKEGEWFKEKLPYIKERASKGNEDFAGMVKELDEREDLKQLLV